MARLIYGTGMNESAAGDQRSGASGGDSEAGILPFVAAQFRDALIGGGLRHPDRSRIAGARERGDDADLHARDAEAGTRGEKSAGCLNPKSSSTTDEHRWTQMRENLDMGLMSPIG